MKKNEVTFFYYIFFLVYEKLIFDVLDWDRSNGIQITSGCKFEKEETSNKCIFCNVHHVQKNYNLYVD